jgi:hypothetical protein
MWDVWNTGIAGSNLADNMELLSSSLVLRFLCRWDSLILHQIIKDGQRKMLCFEQFRHGEERLIHKYFD